MQRSDSRANVIDTATLPRVHGGSSAQEMLELLGDFFEAATKASSGLPPLSLAFDGCTLNSIMNAAFAGLLSEAMLQQLPWFRSCKVKQIPRLKCWPYGYLEYHSEPRAANYLVCAWNGAFPVQKRFSLQLLGCNRKVTFGAVFVECSPLLARKLPGKVYGGADVMSDRAAVMRLSQPYLHRSCMSIGLHVAAFVAALQASMTTASKGFSKVQMCENSFSVHYLLALHVCFNQHVFGNKWQGHSLSAQTVKNCCMLAAHGITAALTDIEPCTTQELGIETYFSLLKQPFRGAPSIRDCVQSTTRAVLKTMKAMTQQPTTEPAREDRMPLSAEAIATCGARSLLASIQFFTFLCVNQTADEAYYIFNKWFETKGAKFFGGVVEAGPEDFVDLAFEEPGGEQQEVCEAAEVAHEKDFNTVQAVADRASMTEEVAELYDEIQQDTAPAAESMDEAPTAGDPLNIFGPPDADAGDKQPFTLVEVVQQALVTKKAVFSMDTPAAEGEKACLERCRYLIPPIRQFIRYTRCEEGVLSVATVEDGVPDGSGNLWNNREHLLAVARRNAEMSRTRVSRFAMWSSTQKRLSVKVAEATGQCDGLTPVETYRPCSSEESPQILAVRDTTGRV